MHTTLSMTAFRQFMAIGFSSIFFVLALSLTALSGDAMLRGLSGELKFTEAILKAINMAIVGLAIFELGLVVNKEYAGKNHDHHIVIVLRRTLPRFVSIVCIALVLEGLLMVIKYSQLDLAGNLYYPVAIITSAALLLASLGVFLRLSGNPDDLSVPLGKSVFDEAPHRPNYTPYPPVTASATMAGEHPQYRRQ
ncbi:MAG: hypothetical protein R6X15_04190 [Pseudomonadota bacterium]